MKHLEYFNKFEIEKIEPLINSVSLKREPKRSLIFYKCNQTYYEIDEPIRSVLKKLETQPIKPTKIGFKYKHRK